MGLKLIVLIACYISIVHSKRFAYVTVHYEGTKRDAEYVLGIQTLMQSIMLTGTKHDLVVLVSDTVTQATRALFQRIGCRIVDVKNIENPFLGSTLKNKGFVYTLNKLHVWNLVEYDRIVYLDADNLMIRNADELFQCGHFCAVFMNPCHFHTGLLVVTPDVKEYNRLLKALHHLASFDGADQGFLSSAYSNSMRQSRLFLPNSKSELPKDVYTTQRLSVGYNINHKYFYEQYHWRLFMLRHFGPMTFDSSPLKVVVESARFIPAITIGFPMAPVLKPWYWWACFFMDLHWVWHDVRSTFHPNLEKYGWLVFREGIIEGLFIFLSLSSIVFFLKRLFPNPKSSNMVRRFAKVFRRWIPTIIIWFRIILNLLTLWLAPKTIHRLIDARYGFTLFIYNHHLLLLFCVCTLHYFWFHPPHSTSFLPSILFSKRLWRSILLSICMEIMIVWISRLRIYPNVLIRLIFIAILSLLCTLGQSFLILGIGTIDIYNKENRKASQHQA